MARKKTIDELRIECDKAEQDCEAQTGKPEIAEGQGNRANPQCANPPSLDSRSYTSLTAETVMLLLLHFG